MTLRLEQLPDNNLKEIFKLIYPNELFNLRFLKKRFFKVIESVIEYNLIYSTYGEFEEYQSHQEKFIKGNGLLIKHLSINSNTIECLNYCPNVLSIKYTETPGNYNFKEGVLDVKLPKLKKLVIESPKYIEVFELFKMSLKQLEVVEVSGDIIIVYDLIKYLNPNKLRSLLLDTNFNYLYLYGLDIIKKEFKKLRKLELRAISYFYATDNWINLDANYKLKVENDPSINFNPDLELDIRVNLDYVNEINVFGDLKKIKSVKIVDYEGKYLDSDNADNDLKTFEGSNIVSLGHFYPTDSGGTVNYKFLRLSSLKEITVSGISKELFKQVSLLSHIQHLYINLVESNINEIFDDFDLSNDDIYNLKYDSLRCNSVKQITIESFVDSFNHFLCFLSLFPALEVLKVDYFKLESIDMSINFKPSTGVPVLVIIRRIRDIDEADFNKLKKEASILNWMSL
ncbi:hypothetical protein K502DRAFT_350626 [Neoconidiobolus thromboides FSU 785]|nr:hypothetical protein K502DRAFT_350626 [Neoconidiobolus thromboides FSU 785]